MMRPTQRIDVGGQASYTINRDSTPLVFYESKSGALERQHKVRFIDDII